MPDLKQRLHGIDRLPIPDLWEQARLKARSLPTPTTPSFARRAAVIAAALLLSVVAIAFLLIAFKPQRGEPATPPPVTVENGDIWVQVGGGDGATAIYRVDPQMQQIPGAMWADSPNVFGGAEVAPQLIADDYAFSQDGSQVAFSAQSHQGGNETPRELFVMNAKGSGLRQLTHDGAYAGFPAWSPDGSKIAYTSYRGTDYIPGCLGFSICPTDLYIIDAGGGTPTPLVSNDAASETTPTWSPDGTRLAFAEIADSNTGVIVTIRTDGTGRVELSPGGMVFYPSWSPDGRWILFLRTQDGTNHIWTATPDDSGHHDVVDTHTDTNVGRPVWSPDGDLIAFARPYAGTASLWTIDAAGDRSPERLAGWPGFDGAPIAWQPLPSATSAETGTVTKTLVLECGSGRVTNVSPGVEASADGVHVQVISTGGWPEVMFKNWGSVIIDGTRATLALDLPPGSHGVRCVFDKSDRTGDYYAFEVVDPDGLWMDLTLDCPGKSIEVEYVNNEPLHAHGDPREEMTAFTEKQFAGRFPEAGTVTPVGYPQAERPYFGYVTSSGSVLGIVGFHEGLPGDWLPEFYRACKF